MRHDINADSVTGCEPTQPADTTSGPVVVPLVLDGTSTCLEDIGLSLRDVVVPQDLVLTTTSSYVRILKVSIPSGVSLTIQRMNTSEKDSLWIEILDGSDLHGRLVVTAQARPGAAGGTGQPGNPGKNASMGSPAGDGTPGGKGGTGEPGKAGVRLTLTLGQPALDGTVLVESCGGPGGPGGPGGRGGWGGEGLKGWRGRGNDGPVGPVGAGAVGGSGGLVRLAVIANDKNARELHAWLASHVTLNSVAGSGGAGNPAGGTGMTLASVTEIYLPRDYVDQFFGLHIG